MRYTNRAWWTVEDAARLIRVNKHTLYRAVQADDFPHSRVGKYVRIPAEALLLTVRPETRSRPWHVQHLADPYQYEFLFDPPVVPVRRYRNGEVRNVGDYEVSLSLGRKWRND